jgi:serine protease Do
MESLKAGINWHSPVENFLDVYRRLGNGEVVELTKDLSAKWESRPDRGGAWAATENLRDTMAAARACVVEVVGDDKVVALGLIVDKDGQVLTKRTELTGPAGPRRLVCRFSDGRQIGARVLRESRDHDLAFLSVPAKDLPAVRWAKSGQPRAGQLIASLDPAAEPLHYAVIGAVCVKNPGTKGELPVRIKPAPAVAIGVAFAEFVPARLDAEAVRGSLTAGDLITSLDGVATPTPAAFAKVCADFTDRPEALEGEWMKLIVARDQKTLDVFLPLVAGEPPIPIPWRDARWNLRRSGFPNVFCHDGAVAFDRCGGPVVNRQGEVIGINIARADPIRSFAIPHDVAQQVIAELRKR